MVCFHVDNILTYFGVMRGLSDFSCK